VEQIKDTLKIILGQLESKSQAIPKNSIEGWLKNALTKKELRHIRIKYFKNGVLGLSVDSSSWLYALSLKKEEILMKLQKESGLVKNIALRIGEI